MDNKYTDDITDWRYSKANPIITDYQDVGYGAYPTINDYIAESERVGYLKSVIRAKKQVIQMLSRELMELEGELNAELNKASEDSSMNAYRAWYNSKEYAERDLRKGS